MSEDELREFCIRYFARWEQTRKRLRGKATRAERLAWLRDPDALAATDLEVQIHGSGEEAEEAWPIILALIAHAPSEEALNYVGAGPLEALVRHHAARFADRLVGQAQRDARFLTALGGVWGWEEVPELYGRLLKIIDVQAAPESGPGPTRRRRSSTGRQKRMRR